MSVWGRKGSYQAVTSTVVLWLLVGTATMIARPYIPPPDGQSQATGPGEFVRQGRGQLVRWVDLTPETVQNAKRLDKPLFIAEGTAWSTARYKAEKQFENPDVAELLNREFVPVRIDQTLEPLWRASLQQVVRCKAGDDLAYGWVIVSPEGRLLANVGDEEMQSLNDRTFLSLLRRALQRFATEDTIEIDQAARDEAFRLAGGVSGSGADFASYFDRLSGKLDEGRGRLLLRSYYRISPLDLESLVRTGRWRTAETAVTWLAGSGQLDLINGGYVESMSIRHNDQSDYVQVEETNAAMLRALALLAAVSHGKFARELAVQQLATVQHRLERDLPGGYLHIEATEDGRSPVQSVPSARLREKLTVAEQQLAAQYLGLGNESALMLPKILDVNHYLAHQDEYSALLAKLVDDQASFAAEPGLDRLAATADSLAACLFASRLLGLKGASEIALSSANRLRDRMRAGIDDVLAVNRDETTIKGSLPDYMSYLSLAWEAFLTTGDDDWCADARLVLTRATFLFGDGKGNIYPCPVETVPAEWLELFAPEVVDSYSGGSQSRFAVLASRFGRVPGGGQAAAGLRQQASKICDRTAWVIESLDHGAAVIAQACQVTRGPLLAFAGTADWPGWASRWPELTIVPGGKALASREPGVYVAGQHGWKGPLPPQELDRLAAVNRM